MVKKDGGRGGASKLTVEYVPDVTERLTVVADEEVLS